MRASFSLPPFSPGLSGSDGRPLSPTPARLPRGLSSHRRRARRALSVGRRVVGALTRRPPARRPGLGLEGSGRRGRRGGGARRAGAGGECGGRCEGVGGERAQEKRRCICSESAKEERTEGAGAEKSREHPAGGVGKTENLQSAGTRAGERRRKEAERRKGKIRASSHLSPKGRV